MKDIKIDFISIKKKLAKWQSRFSNHYAFVGVMIVLLIYLFTVWQIRSLAIAEPTPEQEGSAEVVSLPKIDEEAIKQIQALEQNSPQVRSLFDAARNNPFNE